MHVCAKRADLTVYVCDVCDDAPLAHNVMHTHAAVAIELFPVRVCVLVWLAVQWGAHRHRHRHRTAELQA